MNILEVGAGKGGAHLSLRPNMPSYFLNDINVEALEIAHSNYPHTQIIPGRFNRSTFEKGFFDRIEIRFPFESLLAPGLQQTAKDRAAHSAEIDMLPEDFESPQLYADFAEVLKPSGALLIWGDTYVNPQAIRDLSRPHFRFKSISDVSMGELRRMQTRHALFLEDLLSKVSKDTRRRDAPVKIELVRN